MIPRHCHLVPTQSVLDNVAKPLNANGLSPSQKRHRAERLIRIRDGTISEDLPLASA